MAAKKTGKKNYGLENRSRPYQEGSNRTITGWPVNAKSERGGKEGENLGLIKKLKKKPEASREPLLPAIGDGRRRTQENNKSGKRGTQRDGQGGVA